MDREIRKGRFAAALTVAKRVFITIAMIVAILLGVIFYETSLRRESIIKDSSPDEVYVLTVTSIGEPGWPFGAAHCELTLKRGRRRISYQPCEVWNDGGWAHPENFAVQWGEEKVTVTVSADEAPDKDYELWFDGSVTVSEP